MAERSWISKSFGVPSKQVCLLLLILTNSNFKYVYIYISVDAQVTFDSLQYLEKDDIKEAIPPIGLRAKFRSKLFEWRKKEFGIECEEEDSLRSDILKWVKQSSFKVHLQRHPLFKIYPMSMAVLIKIYQVFWMKLLREEPY
ncbi:PREDICTED: uncharacterized protein LOC108353999 isoform X2 [Rhagoletis zephyria]|uniref:uncharacterized protein LOC108353999 isoform X2 n=1 Tax=Rhagoletis zephyria TaxID=28612 RepID=UPI0008112F1D|nr:PREDICTED: uncharacterized protein LOC108353999 isoform X2 [Rhagoletis zephyria]